MIESDVQIEMHNCQSCTKLQSLTKIRESETKEIIGIKLRNKNVIFYRNISSSMEWIPSSGREHNMFHNPFHEDFYLNNSSSVNIFPWLPRFSVSEKLQWLGFFFFGNGVAHLSH
jgi:hypothetical protein